MSTMDQTKAYLKIQTFGAYDLQKLRMQMGLRLVANFRAKLKVEGDDEPETDPETGEPIETGELSERAEKIIDVLRASYKTLTEGIARHRTLPEESKFVGDPVISEFTELVLVHQFFEIEKHERSQFRQLESTLSKIPIYEHWLKGITGIGPAMAAVLITYFDVEEAKYPSQFWSYAGLDVADDGAGRSRRKEHLVQHEYIDKNKDRKTRVGLSHNGWLKARLLGALATSFMRAKNCPYRQDYDNYKHRLMSDPSREKCTVAEYKKKFRANYDEDDPGRAWKAVRHLYPPGRFHRMSLRYMVKMFLKDFWREWRGIEGLPIVPTYHEGVLGHVHHKPSGPGGEAHP